MAKRQQTEASDFRPDRDDLDGEWIKQPGLYHKYATDLADARATLEEERNTFEVVRADLDAEIRANPEQYDLNKVTEEVVKNTVLLQPKYKKGQKKVNEARHRVDILSAAVTALDHKKKALENLVFLHGQNYFASPRARGEDAEAMREVEKADTRRKIPKRTREQLREEDEE